MHARLPSAHDTGKKLYMLKWQTQFTDAGATLINSIISVGMQLKHFYARRANEESETAPGAAADKGLSTSILSLCGRSTQMLTKVQPLEHHGSASELAAGVGVAFAVAFGLAFALATLVAVSAAPLSWSLFIALVADAEFEATALATCRMASSVV